jgi:hypothetical protein
MRESKGRGLRSCLYDVQLSGAYSDEENLKWLMYICNVSHWAILKIPRPIYAGKSFFPSAYKQEMEHY